MSYNHLYSFDTFILSKKRYEITIYIRLDELDLTLEHHKHKLIGGDLIFFHVNLSYLEVQY